MYYVVDERTMSRLMYDLETHLDDATNLDLPIHKMFDRNDLAWRRHTYKD